MWEPVNNENKVSQPHGETERYDGHGKVGDQPLHGHRNATEPPAQKPARQKTDPESEEFQQEGTRQRQQAAGDRTGTGTIQESCHRSNHPGSVRQGPEDQDYHEQCKIKSGGKWADGGARLPVPEIFAGNHGDQPDILVRTRMYAV